jgi:hypothetical protein
MDVPGFARAATSVFVVGLIGGAGVLMVLPSDEAPSSIGTAVMVPDPPAPPCKRQVWPNTDRSCQKWTTPRDEVAKIESYSVREVANDSTPPYERTPLRLMTKTEEPQAQGASPVIAQRDEVAPVEAAPLEARPPEAAPARVVRRPRTEPAPQARGTGTNANGITVIAVAADGSRRTIVIHPTSQQDYYYYARITGMGSGAR